LRRKYERAENTEQWRTISVLRNLRPPGHYTDRRQTDRAK
jgi:hypothetical protein